MELIKSYELIKMLENYDYRIQSFYEE